LGVCGAALAPSVEGLALGGEAAPVAAIPSASEQEVGGAEVVLEDDGELGDREGGGGSLDRGSAAALGKKPP
jgi:hypothetical protein